MNAIDILEKKKNKKELTKEEINYIVESYVKDEVKDYQMSALLMAICINGMSNSETFYLTEAMLNSGDTIDLNAVPGITVDKHSTGGVGDKTTLIVGPLVSACGVNVAKMSGRGLGHTGGTIDKLESIEGFNTEINTNDFINQVKNIGICLCSCNKNLVPADKKIYALRDVTATFDSIPLIASSIMSKKIASGCNKIVIDLKVGNGAAMTNLNDATTLANIMIKIGTHFNKEVICLLTNMNEPLGHSVGNSLEVIEAINTLNGKGPDDLTNLSILISAYMVYLSKNIVLDEAMKLVTEKLYDGSAYKKFIEFINAQGGNLDNIKICENKIDVLSKSKGFVTSIDTHKIGELANILGAGKKNKTDLIDHGVGIVLNKKIGDVVNIDTKLMEVYYNPERTNNIDVIKEELLKTYTIDTIKKNELPLVFKIIK